ncbi:MAG: helix-turn-helix transcriptional regulator [Myxococcota bacterium]
MQGLKPLPRGRVERARGLVSCAKSGSRIDAERFAPPSDLSDGVECFWLGRWDLPADAPHTTELLGDPSIHIVFEGDRSRVVGVWTRRWIRTLEGTGFVRGAKLRPGAAGLFLRGHAADFTDRITPLSEAPFPSCESWIESIARTPSDTDAFERFGQVLRSARQPMTPEIELAIGAAERLRDPSIHSVERLAEDSGCTVRALQRLFRKHVGAPPKALLRRVRLQEAAARIDRGEAENLARLAAELGYTDQAHFTRDFRTAVGRSPGQLRTARATLA